MQSATSTLWASVCTSILMSLALSSSFAADTAGPPQGIAPFIEADMKSQPPSKDPRNFEGTWRNVPLPGSMPMLIGMDLPYKPSTKQIVDARIASTRGGAPIASAHLTCRPTGVAGVLAAKSAVLVLQTADKLMFLSEEDREVRHVYVNQTHPKKLQPSYTGDSVAHWEGNTLVIDTIGYNGKGWLDEWATPHSDQLHMIQHITKSADGTMLTIESTFDDPVYYSQPFTKTHRWLWTPGARLIDYDCSENPRSDDFEGLIFEEEWFKPTCMRPVENGVSADSVVCKAPKSKR